MQKYPQGEVKDLAVWRRARMCTRKQAFASFDEALTFIKGSPEPWAKRPRIYGCPLCGHFHLTSKQKGLLRSRV